jgi:hypothetical protein
LLTLYSTLFGRECGSRIGDELVMQKILAKGDGGMARIDQCDGPQARNVEQ